MTLPEIVLPKVILPFDIPVLLHPAVVHFLVAIPVVILLLELINLIMKKKAVGGVSFFLIVLTLLAAVGAYFTGLADGKEAYPALSEVAKTALGEHKLLGTYILLGIGLIFIFKLLALTGNKILKGLYVLMLVVLVAALFKQGKEGGELVYEHGLNVEAVTQLNDEIFDLNEELEDEKEKAVPATTIPAPEVEVKAPIVTPKIEEVKVQTPIKEETPVETIGSEVKEVMHTKVKALVAPLSPVVESKAAELIVPEQ